MSDEGFREQLRQQHVNDLIEQTRAKWHGAIKPESGSPGYVAALKAEILARPPLVMTPELIQREKDLAEERLAALERRMASGATG